MLDSGTGAVQSQSCSRQWWKVPGKELACVAEELKRVGGKRPPGSSLLLLLSPLLRAHPNEALTPTASSVLAGVTEYLCVCGPCQAKWPLA